mgnify:CR=1 FL=1
MSDLSAIKQNKKKVFETIDEPNKVEKKKLGRTPKKPEKRLTEKVTINFTIAEKEKLMALSQEKGNLPLTILIRNVLKEQGII